MNKDDRCMQAVAVLMLVLCVGFSLSCGNGGGPNLPTQPDTTPPSDVSNLAATPGNNQITLTWTDPSDTDLSEILILCNTTGTFTTPTDGIAYVDGTYTGPGGVWCKNISKGTGFYINTGLTNGTFYYYKVYAYDTSMNYSSPGKTANEAPHSSLYFAATLGGENDEVIFVVEETADAGYIYGGYTESSGAGDRDLLLVKTDENGLIEWQKTIGGSLIDDVQSILVLADGYIICGYTQSFGNGEYDVWVLKISLSGYIIWQKIYGGEKTEYGKSIKRTADGGYILVGYTGSFGEGASDIWVIKLNKYGDIEWQKTYGESDVENSYSIIETSDGGYIVSGMKHYLPNNNQQIYLIFKISSLGELEWKKLYGIGGNTSTYSMTKTDDEGFIVAGYTDSLGTNSVDIILVKFDILGNVQWQKAYFGSGEDFAFSVIKTSNNGYFLTGFSNSTEDGSYDIIALRLDGTGNIVWQKAYGGSEDDVSKSYRSIETEKGDFVILGNTNSFNDSGYDAIMLKVPSTGELLGISRKIALTVSEANFQITESSILSNDSNAASSDSNLQFVDSNLLFSYQKRAMQKN